MGGRVTVIALAIAAVAAYVLARLLWNRRSELRPGRPWWRRKRWAALAAWLAAAYPLGLWAAGYLEGRGLFTAGDPAGRVVTVAYGPLAAVALTPAGPRPGFGWYFDAFLRFRELGHRHAASD